MLPTSRLQNLPHLSLASSNMFLLLPSPMAMFQQVVRPDQTSTTSSPPYKPHASFLRPLQMRTNIEILTLQNSHQLFPLTLHTPLRQHSRQHAHKLNLTELLGRTQAWPHRPRCVQHSIRDFQHLFSRSRHRNKALWPEVRDILAPSRRQMRAVEIEPDACLWRYRDAVVFVERERNW